MYTDGLPNGSALPMKPGLKASTCENRSPFKSPSESAYEPPSEKPPIASRFASTLQAPNAQARQ